MYCSLYTKHEPWKRRQTEGKRRANMVQILWVYVCHFVIEIFYFIRITATAALRNNLTVCLMWAFKKIWCHNCKRIRSFIRRFNLKNKTIKWTIKNIKQVLFTHHTGRTIRSTKLHLSVLLPLSFHPHPQIRKLKISNNLCSERMETLFMYTHGPTWHDVLVLFSDVTVIL